MREENVLQEKSKGKTKEGANDPLTMGDLQSHRKMFYLLKNTFPEVMVSPDFFTSACCLEISWENTNYLALYLLAGEGSHL